MSSAIRFSLDQSKILSSDNGLTTEPCNNPFPNKVQEKDKTELVVRILPEQVLYSPTILNSFPNNK